jgi:hypothetical protein
MNGDPPAVTTEPDGDAGKPAGEQDDAAERPRAGGDGDGKARHQPGGSDRRGRNPRRGLHRKQVIQRHPAMIPQSRSEQSPGGSRGSVALTDRDQEIIMGFDQYHEPPEELPPATRTFARLCASLTEEAEAIGWYEQRLAVETDPEAASVMRDAVGEEFKHFSMDLEFLLRRSPTWRQIAQGVLFKTGDIVEHGEEAEAEAGGEDSSGYADDGSGSLGIGSMKGAIR